MFITFSSADVQITGAAAWRELSTFSWHKICVNAANSPVKRRAATTAPLLLLWCPRSFDHVALSSKHLIFVRAPFSKSNRIHRQRSFRPESRIIVSSEIKLVSNWKVLIDTITSNCAHTLWRGFIFIKLHEHAQILLFDAGILLVRHD